MVPFKLKNIYFKKLISCSGSMVEVKCHCVVIWMYVVMSMRGNPQYTDNSVCRADLEECIPRRRLVSYTWRIQKKKNWLQEENSDDFMNWVKVYMEENSSVISVIVALLDVNTRRLN